MRDDSFSLSTWATIKFRARMEADSNTYMETLMACILISFLPIPDFFLLGLVGLSAYFVYTLISKRKIKLTFRDPKKIGKKEKAREVIVYIL